MNYHRIRLVTAIFAMAVICIGLMSGCATKRDIAVVNERLSRIELQTHQTEKMVADMDSVISTGAEASRMLQNDIRQSTEELITQMTQLLENYQDLMSRIDQMSGQQVIKVSPTSSPGAQATDQAPPPSTSQQAEADCIDTYDNAFTLVRRGEYETAIEGFREFLTNCETHTDVQNAYYWIGECYYSQEKYTQAVVEYDHLLKNYPNTPNIGRALYKLARCKQELGKKDEAKQLFEQLVNDHAGTLEAEQAAQRLKDL